MNIITVRVTEREILDREMDPYYLRNNASALADLIEEKAGVTKFIGLGTGVSFTDRMNAVMHEVGANYYTGTIHNDTMERVYTFYDQSQ